MTDNPDQAPATRNPPADWFTRFDPPREHIQRVIALNDGVFAFALTLLAVEVRPPAHWDGTLAGLGRDFYLGCAAYLFGFAILGALWMRQRLALSLLARIDTVATALILVSLAVVALMPAAVGMQVRYTNTPLSSVIYAGVFLALILASTVLWAYIALIARLVHPELPERYRIGQLGAQLLMALTIAAAMGAFWDVRSDSGASFNWLAAAAVCIAASSALRRWSRKPPPQAG